MPWCARRKKTIRKGKERERKLRGKKKCGGGRRRRRAVKTDRQVVFLSEAKKSKSDRNPFSFWPIHRKNSQLPSGKYIFFLEIYEGKLFACLRRYACSRDLNARLRFPSSALSISADGGNYRLFCTSESASSAAARVGPLVPVGLRPERHSGC